MKTSSSLVVLCAVLASAAVPLAAQTPQEPLVGTWVGNLKVGAVVLRLVFNVTATPGGLTATMDSPDQGARGIPVSKARRDGTQALFEVAAAAGSYAGTIAVDGGSIDGSWKQGGQGFPVILFKQAGPFVLERPQEPHPPFPYTSTDVTIQNARAGVQLAGTLTVPTGTGPFPAVVLVTGSGPQNRDEEILGHKPFLVSADYLSRNGIAVLRYDDRGVGKSTGVFSQATTMDFADDAEAAFTFLAARPEVDAKRAGIAGHSEGGLIAPIVAARNPGVDFVVLLAGPGIRGDKLLLLQAAAIARAAGAAEEQVRSAADINAALYAVASKDVDTSAVLAESRKILEKAIDTDASLSQSDKEKARAGIDQVIAPLASPWFRAFLRLDAAAYLGKLRIPVLALDGTKDLQVPADEDLAGIDTALKAAGNTTYRLLRMDGLNHLFQHAVSGLPEEYGTISETFAPEALAAIKDFVMALR